eukprot:jgi/Mesvir1/26981/Mv25918-RA.1
MAYLQRRFEGAKGFFVSIVMDGLAKMKTAVPTRGSASKDWLASRKLHIPYQLVCSILHGVRTYFRVIMPWVANSEVSGNSGRVTATVLTHQLLEVVVARPWEKSHIPEIRAFGLNCPHPRPSTGWGWGQVT